MVKRFVHAMPGAMTWLVLGVAMLLVGCVPVELPPRQVQSGDLPRLSLWENSDLHYLMESRDTWFTVDSQGRGVVKGYATGAGMTAGPAGTFELAVISKYEDIPVQQVVVVHYGPNTRVIVGDKNVGSVGEGVEKHTTYDVTRGDRVLEVPFHVDDGRLFADQVRVATEPDPNLP